MAESDYRALYAAWCAIPHDQWRREWSRLTIAEVVAKIRS